MTEPLIRPGLELLFRPSSVALIGVSPETSRPATRALRALVRGGSPLRIYPINPKYENVDGVRCYEDISGLPEVPDLVVIALRANAVVGAVAAAADFGTRAFMVFSSGFSEVGAPGLEEENRLKQMAHDRGLLILGPNSLGLINCVDRIWCSFSSILQQPGELRSGRVALVTQSGAVGAYVYAMADARGFGFSHIVSTGNEATLEAADVAAYLLKQPEVDAVAMYVEGVRDGQRFIECCDLASELGKPVIVLRAGDSAGGRAAAKSHTGALAGSSQVSDAVFAEHGVTRVLSPEDLVTACQLLQARQVPEGRGIGILTVSGGGGVLVADSASRWGLELPALDHKTDERLAELLPAWAAIGNPTDVTATVLLDEAPTLVQSIRVMSEDPSVDQVVIFMGAGGSSAAFTARQFVEALGYADKPCMVVWLGIPPEAERILREGEVPYFHGIEEALRPLSALGNRAPATYPGEAMSPLRLSPTRRRAALELLTQTHSDILNEVESKAVLEAIGLTQLPQRRFLPFKGEMPELTDISSDLGYPMVVKLVARRVIHKNAVGAVHTGIEGPDALVESARQVFSAGIDAVGPDGVEGLLVEQMAPKGIEVIVGAVFDPTFGYCLMVGPGGILAELIADVVVILPPANLEKVLAAISGTQLEKLLVGNGTADEPDYDVDAMASVVSALSTFLSDVDPALLKEMDINPLIVHPRGQGASVVDCLISR